MKYVVAGAALIAGLCAAPVGAQQRPADAPRDARDARDAGARIEHAIDESGVVPALEALATAVTPELERTVGELAATLGVLADRIARDPELRASAARAARGMVDVAELVVVEQTTVLQEVLREAADRLEAAARGAERNRQDRPTP